MKRGQLACTAALFVHALLLPQCVHKIYIPATITPCLSVAIAAQLCYNEVHIIY
jgi:hypothetical protein